MLLLLSSHSSANENIKKHDFDAQKLLTLWMNGGIIRESPQHLKGCDGDTKEP